MANHVIRFYLVEIVSYSDFDGYSLTTIPMKDDDRVRYAFKVDGYMFDMETGEQLFPLSKDAYDRIDQPIFRNRKYVVKAIEQTQISDKVLEECVEKYNEIVEVNKLINEGKILRFQPKRLY